MDAKGGCSGWFRPRTGRSVRVSGWAGALLALAAGGLFASAQAAEHERATATMSESFACASGVRLGYDVAYEPQIGSHAVVGVALKTFPVECAGRTVRVEVLDAHGALLALAHLDLADDAVADLVAAAPVDARDVAALRVHPG